ncbi:MAG: two-component system OmpR family response regulator [Yoonia sp.]|jgi:two-component system OmpR family response regulator
MKILLLEDDKTILRRVKDCLTRCGHVVDWLENGRNTLIAAITHDYNVTASDRMTPELDGFSVLKAVRASKNMTPALFLAALRG